jgi:FAD/FMN-containing dehydrogenase
MLSVQLSFAILVSLAVSGARSEYNTAYEACSSLSQILPGQVSFPQSQGYEDSLSSYAFIGTRLRPACIVSPKATGDVVTIVQTLGNFENVPFAVRSGGHNTNIGTSHYIMGLVSYSDPAAGFANVQNGVTIDLSGLNSVTLENSARTVFVGPGARWQSVYNTLDPYGLTVQGGRNGKVGVAGFLTGGKLDFLSIMRVLS